MSALNTIFYLVAFPGLIFSTVLGLLLMGIEIQVSDLLRKRKVLSIFKPFQDLLELFAEGRKEWSKSFKKPVFIILILGLMAAAAVPMFIPLFKYRWLESSQNIVIIMYLMIVPAISLIAAGFSQSIQNNGMSLLRRVLSILYSQLLVSVILIITAGRASSSLDEGFTFSLNKIGAFQSIYGFGITKWELIPASLAFILLIPVISGGFPFNIIQLEKKDQEDIKECGSLYILIYKITQAIVVFFMISLFSALFFGGSGMQLTGGYAVDLLIDIVLLILIGALIITAVFNFARVAAERLGVKRTVRFYKVIPSAFVLISMILVCL